MRSLLTVGSIYLCRAIDSEPILKSLPLSCLFKSKRVRTHRANSLSSKNPPITIESKVKYNFSSCLLGFRVLRFNSVFSEEAQRAGKTHENTESIYILVWCCREHGQNLNFLWSYEPSTFLSLTLLSFPLPQSESGFHGFYWLLISI